MPAAVQARFDETVERTYPDGISKVRAIIGSRRDLPLGRNVPSPVLFSFGVATIHPGGEIPRHTHWDREELFFVQSGTATLEVQAEVCEVDPGTAVWFPAGCEHHLRNQKAEPVVVIFVGLAIQGQGAGSGTPAGRVPG